MVTISHLVEKKFEENLFLQEALSKGLLNNAAVAESMMPELGKELKHEVKFSAVNMAIRRLGEKLEKTQNKRKIFAKDTDITIKSDLVEITIIKSEDTQKTIKALYGLVNLKKDLLTITIGIDEIMIIVGDKYEKKIIEVIPQKQLKKMVKNLSSLTINIPESSIHEVGLIYAMSKTFAWENLSIVDIVSTLTEMTLIVREDDTARSFDIIKKVIRNNS